MTRLIVHVEGQTEEDFVNEVLRPHLEGSGYESVSARIIGNSRLRQKRGGIRPWPTVKRDIINHLRQDFGCVATTMVDFYGMPLTGDGGWPGRAEANTLALDARATFVEEKLLANLTQEMGADFNAQRFVPFVIMHEFEALLFSDCQAFARGIGQPHLTAKFQEIRDGFPSPEAINDSPTSAPSKRVEAIVPGYEKPLLGILAILEIGLDTIQAECQHFRAWLRRLELIVS